MREGGNKIDILFLVDQLEELVNESRRVPITGDVIIDAERFMNLVDQMRLAIPAEIRQAQRVQQERERVLAQAREEARRLIERANEEASKAVGDQVLVQQARERGEEIIARAYEEARALRRDADSYALGMLRSLLQQLQALQQEVHNGIAALQDVLETDLDGHTSPPEEPI